MRRKISGTEHPNESGCRSLVSYENKLHKLKKIYEILLFARLLNTPLTNTLEENVHELVAAEAGNVRRRRCRRSDAISSGSIRYDQLCHKPAGVLLASSRQSGLRTVSGLLMMYFNLLRFF